MYYEIGGYVMRYSEFEEMCHKAWSERFNYLCIDMTKNVNEGKYRNFNESKPHILNILLKVSLFNKINVVSS